MFSNGLISRHIGSPQVDKVAWLPEFGRVGDSRCARAARHPIGMIANGAMVRGTIVNTGHETGLIVRIEAIYGVCRAQRKACVADRASVEAGSKY